MRCPWPGAVAREQAHQDGLGSDIAGAGVHLSEVPIDLGAAAARSVGRPETGEVLALDIGAGAVAHRTGFAPAR